MRILISVLFVLLLPLTAFAQDRPKAILVLDASGSMWGQIDGKAKITIAQEVMGTLLADLPDTQDLGLTVYGHRRKGDCTDIETIVAPGADTRAAISGAVNSIKPKGKTPMTDAVIAAAEALKYTEEKATVILVSDGIETCAPDPCAAARQLEQTGVDFTAHVVGFDVTEEEALRQMQCIADETGGTFRTASNAAELSEALVTVAAAPEPRDVTFRAVEGPGGPEITTNLIWTIRGPDSVLADTEPAVSMTFPLLPGTYTAEALRPEDEEYVEITAQVVPSTNTITLVFPERPEPVRIQFVATDGDRGRQINNGIVWTLKDAQGETLTDNITDAIPTLSLTKGEYQIQVRRVIDGATTTETIGVGKVNKQVRVALPEYRPLATIEAPDSAPLGSFATIRWTGPDAQNDYIAIHSPDGTNNTWINYTYTREGSPLKVLMPPQPGTYELRYILADGRKIIARKTIQVTPIDLTIDAPETAPLGARIPVGWTGPDAPNDYIAIHTPDGPDNNWINYTYTREGSPLQLEMPGEPGTYEIRYVFADDRSVLVRRTIEVVPISITLEAPDTAPLGSTVAVTWDGPDEQNDFIAIVKKGADEGTWINYTYTRDGSPLKLTVPNEAGDYEIRYVLSQDRKTLATRPITVAPVDVSLTADPSAVAGADVTVGWVGPDAQNDFIAVVAAGADEGTWINYTYTRDGTPLKLKMPVQPGDYEIRYVLGQGRKTLAAQPISVTALSGALTAPPTANEGDTITVDWTGPDYQNDFIAVVKQGADEGTWINYTYTREGAPLKLRMPPEPGSYEIRYVLGQGRSTLASAPIQVQPISATLSAPTQATAGASVVVSWDGPDYQNDYISVGKPDAANNRYEAYTYTREGSPLQVQMPVEPGDYVIRYVVNANPAKTLAEVPVTVTPVTATLQANATVAPGGNLAVTWQGPDYRNDFISIAKPGADKYETYTYTREGSPLIIKAPQVPGTYELRYTVSQGRKVIATQTLTVE